MKKVFILCLVVFMVLGLVGIANANTFPEKPIKLIVPWAPGGGTDTVGRMLSKYGEKYFGVPIVVENVEGGMGAIALQRVKTAKPTGYELVIASGYVGWMDKIRDFPVNFNDFTPVMCLNRDPAAFTVSAKAPWNTIEEFVEYAKEHPGEITVGHSGEGLVWHLAGASVADYFGLDFNYVPYNGAAPAIAAVMGGDIDVVTVGGAEVASQVLGGKLKCLGILGADRLTPLPDVPTFKEMGYDVEVYTHRGLVGPKGIPQDVVDALYQGFSKAMQEKEFIEGMENLGLGIFALNSQGYKEFIEKQSAAILKSLKKIGLIE
ncbi:MAG: tripartite tricarboxylate transporter substrate binding protein [Parcubacteria group bacterium]|nr:tripartite tricarboxylate transporter substrate binding protein [Parcubacteria group bacterium]